MNTWRVVLFVFLAQVSSAPQPTGQASVEGIVVRLGSNEPISGVDLELTVQNSPQVVTPSSGSSQTAPPPAPTPFTARSGNDGRFAFRNLPSGAFKLVAARIGGLWVPTEYGQRGILGRGVTFPLGDGEQKRNIRLEMAPVGTITGRVVDENGRPVGHAAVLALAPMYREDQRSFNVMEIVHTDDRGEYRLFSLVPGLYYIAARPEDPNRRTAVLNVVPPGRRGPFEQAVSPVVTKRILASGETVEETYRFVYYGGTTDLPRATPLQLTPGGNIGAVDIALAIGKTKSLHIRGKVIDGTTGNPAAGAAVRLLSRAFSSHMIVPNTTTDASGAFDLAGVVPGSYQIYFLGAQLPQRASTPGVPPPPPPPPLMAMLPLDVGNSDVENLSVSINLGSTITGRVSIEGPQRADSGFSKMRVTVEAVPSGVARVGSFSATPNGESGVIKIENVWPAEYRVLVAGIPSDTYVKSIRLGNIDLLSQSLPVPLASDGSLEILLGADWSTVDGRVVNERQEPVVNVKVALVPDPPLRQRMDLYKSVATDTTGAFRFSTIPPGDYKVFAWEEVEDLAWQNSEFLRLDESRGKSLRAGSLRTESITVTAIPKR